MSGTARIEINPVTRLEGHGKIAIELNEAGKVKDAVFSVAEFRGFEKFCEGRMLWDMPTMTSRICGVCPVSHHLASIKACEDLLGVEPPPAAVKLRELLHHGQFVHSHALHFFFFALPDFISTEQTSIAHRSVLGLIDTQLNFTKNAIKLRKFGQDIIDCVGGGRLHPIAAIPGGMSKALKFIDKVEMFKSSAAALKIAQNGVKMIKDIYAKNSASFQTFASYPSLFMGMTKNNQLEFYDGPLRIIDQNGATVKEFDGREYLANIEERVKPTSWTKFTCFKDKGFPEGFYRVAPLARLNIVDSISTPLANKELKEFKQINGGKPILANMFFHYARMIELLYAVEKCIELLNDPEILSQEVRIPVDRRGGEGVGVLEAPRGTLIHHYWADDNGRVEKVNLIVSTAHNNEAMNRAVGAVADTVVKNGQISPGDLNKLEMAIRCFDPCLSCSTHAYGRMPLEVVINGPNGERLSQYAYGDMAANQGE